MKRREWDTDKAKTLYDEKMSDAEIAGRVGTTASAVAYWRRGLGLPANAGRHPPPPGGTGDKAASTPPASPMLERPENEEDPVELSVKLDDGRFGFLIKAPSPEGARQIYQFAGRLLGEMGQIAVKRKEEVDDA